jgi:hypothetical protein
LPVVTIINILESIREEERMADQEKLLGEIFELALQNDMNYLS